VPSLISYSAVAAPHKLKDLANTNTEASSQGIDTMICLVIKVILNEVMQIRLLKTDFFLQNRPTPS
jgi:hypothetical protein